MWSVRLVEAQKILVRFQTIPPYNGDPNGATKVVEYAKEYSVTNSNIELVILEIKSIIRPKLDSIVSVQEIT